MQMGSTVYSVNQNMMSNLPPMNDEDLYKALDKVSAWVHKNGNKYYMLLNNDLRYYTVFNMLPDGTGDIENELKDILRFMGNVIAIDYNSENDYYEMWVNFIDEPNMFIFFKCDQFVVEI